MKLLRLLSQHLPVTPDLEKFFMEDCITKEYEKGSFISKQDQYHRKVYFLEKGLVRSFYYEDGKDITTNFYQEGRLFANIDTLFKNQPTRYNFETLEDSTITSCDYQKLEELCSTSAVYANFSRFILGTLMTEMASRIASLQYRTAKEKYTQLLAENPTIILRAPLGMIATYLGITQETLSRIRNSI